MKNSGIALRSIALTALRFAGLVPLTGCVPLHISEFHCPSPIKKQPSHWTAQGNHRVDSNGVTGWVNDFDSPILNKLAKDAVDNNFSIAAAMQRVFQAEERARIVRADLFPQLESGLDSTRRQTVSQGRRTRSTSHNLDFFNMSWEIDLWGRIRDAKRSEVLTMDAQCHAYQAARLSLVANVLRRAFEIIESEEQIASLNRNLESLQTNLEILDAKLEAGDADDRTALEITLSRSDIARARSNLAAEKIQRDSSRRLLEALLGRYPRGEIEALKKLPDPKRSVPVGLPSDLLIRRPDILQAEMEINSAIYNFSATQKQLLPSFRLTSGMGTTSSDVFKDLFDFDNLVWNIGQGLTQPLFQGGRIKAQIRLSEHQRDELIETYAETVLVAFREVETALAAERYYNEQVEALRINVKEARLAEELSLSNYEKGLIDIITLLESQRRAFDAESSLLNARLQRLLNRIDLYLALGGDFDTKPCPVDSPPPHDATIMKKLKSEQRP